MKKCLEYKGYDSKGRMVLQDEDSINWKYIEPGYIPLERHDTLFTTVRNEMEGEPAFQMESDYNVY